MASASAGSAWVKSIWNKLCNTISLATLRIM